MVSWSHNSLGVILLPVKVMATFLPARPPLSAGGGRVWDETRSQHVKIIGASLSEPHTDE